MSFPPEHLDNYWQHILEDARAGSPPEPRRKKRKKPEAAVQKKIVSWLLARGVILAVTDAGMLKKMGFNMSCGIPKGWPDITGCLPWGRFLGIECKAPGEEQTEAQALYDDAIQARGGLYIVASSVEELVQELLKEEKLNNPIGIPLAMLHV